jgi:hypothetical protein
LEFSSEHYIEQHSQCFYKHIEAIDQEDSS